MSSEVVIVGAGPVGLSLALGLARQGVESLVLEQTTRPATYVRAFGVHMRTFEIFRSWGVFERFLEEGSLLSTLRLWVPGREAPVAELDLSVLADETFCPGMLFIPQDRIERILLDEVRRTGLCEIRMGQRVTGVRDGEVLVEPEEGEAYRLRARFIVGCDGAHSAVRKSLGLELVGKTYPTRLFMADVRLPDARRELPWPRIAALPRGGMGALRIDADRFRLISVLDPSLPEREQCRPEVLVERLFGPGPFETTWSSIASIHCRNSPRFRVGNALLAGDAAHLASPAGGQSMNSGIQDAHNLAWKLAAALSGGDEERLLNSYEQERRAVILGELDRYTDFFTRLELGSPRWFTAVAGTVAARLLRIPAVLRPFARKAGMLDAVYPPSDLLEKRSRRLDCRLGEGRLLDLVGPGAALVLVDGERLPRWDPAFVERLVPSGVSVHRVGAGLLGRADRCLLLRPDGYVGWTAQRPTGEELLAGVARALGQVR